MKILIVDDEVNVVELIRFNLELNNYVTDVSYHGLDAMDKIDNNNYDLVILDNMLPGMKGIDIIKQIKQNRVTRKLPILMLTANSSQADIIHGLNVGADDYLTKPFSVQELLARVNSLIRRSSSDNFSEPLLFEDFSIYEDEFRLTVRGVKTSITKKEFELLLYMVKKPNILLTRKVLSKEIWGKELSRTSRTVDVHVMSLRKKIEKNSKKPIYFKTIVGEGYKFVKE